MNQSSKTNDIFSETRMNLGGHLDELRSCLIKSLYGLVAAFAICLLFGNQIFSFLAQPLLLALDIAEMDRQLYTTSLPEYFITWIKVSFYTAIFLSAPWVFRQLWSFIASGLYPKEKKFVNTFVPFSAILFILGGAFFVMVVAPIAFSFFISVTSNIKAPEVSDNFVNRLLLKMYDKESPTLNKNFETNDVAENEEAPLIKLIPKVDQYVSLVIVLALAFSIAFQMPLVVFFLGKIGLVRVETLRQVRKYVLLGIVIFSAVMTPPDPISQILLSIPMYLLYEVGIILLRIWPPRGALPRQSM
jgi:sec-independent protein translocase protein TatC